jgi:hypothetical protein
MKKIFILTTIFAISIFAFEVEDKKKFTLRAAPTQMSAGLSFAVSRTSQIAVKTVLDNILKEAKTKGGACKGGEYYIYPTSEYDQNSKKSVRKGYEGNIRFECRFADMSVYDGFLEFINSQVKNKDTEKVYINPILWELSEEERESLGERLKVTALEYTSRRAAELSRATKSACELKKISLEGSESEYRQPLMRTQAAQTQTPIPQAKDVSIAANMLFECKK